jgi:hypothetical protein
MLILSENFIWHPYKDATGIALRPPPCLYRSDAVLSLETDITDMG